MSELTKQELLDLGAQQERLRVTIWLTTLATQLNDLAAQKGATAPASSILLDMADAIRKGDHLRP